MSGDGAAERERREAENRATYFRASQHPALRGGNIVIDPAEFNRMRDSGLSTDGYFPRQSTQAPSPTQAPIVQPAAPTPPAPTFGGNSLLDAVLGNARDRIGGNITNLGLDVNNFNPLIDTALSDAQGRIPLDQLERQYGSEAEGNQVLNAYLQDLTPGILDTRQTNLRSQADQSLNPFFGPGFDLQALPDTSDDPFIDAILSEQFAQAQRVGDSALSRGNINQLGYDNFLADLNSQRPAATSSLTGLGDNILQTNRQELRGIENEARTAAGGLELGQTFDTNTYQQRLADALSRQQSGLEGGLRGAVGSQSFFNPNLALNKASAAGSGNTPGAAALTGLPRADDQQTNRGLGGQGVF